MQPPPNIAGGGEAEGGESGGRDGDVDADVDGVKASSRMEAVVLLLRSSSSLRSSGHLIAFVGPAAAMAMISYSNVISITPS